jgi:hypothetical protein
MSRKKKPFTEQDWLHCSHADSMLDFLRGKVSDRKMRLFACACARRVWTLLPNDPCRQAIETAEAYADGLRSRNDLQAARNAVNDTIPPIDHDHDDLRHRVDDASFWALCSANGTVWPSDYGKDESAAGTVARDARYATGERQNEESIAQCRLLRDIFGPFPFHPTPAVHPEWLAWHDGLISRLARSIYEERGFEQLPILGDALEEAGCSEERILGHCRQAGEHARGCWVVDLLLGKESSAGSS